MEGTHNLSYTNDSDQGIMYKYNVKLSCLEGLFEVGKWRQVPPHSIDEVAMKSLLLVPQTKKGVYPIYVSTIAAGKESKDHAELKVI